MGRFRKMLVGLNIWISDPEETTDFTKLCDPVLHTDDSWLRVSQLREIMKCSMLLVTPTATKFVENVEKKSYDDCKNNFKQKS